MRLGDDLPSLQSGWEWQTIECITDYVSRGRAPRYVDADGVTVLNQKCVRWGGVEWEWAKETSANEAMKRKDEQFLQDGDILWNSTGTGTIGRACRFVPRSEDPVVVDTHVTIVRPGPDIDSRFLVYWISGPLVQNSLFSLQAGSTNQIELSRNRVLETPIPVPDLPIQVAIADKLDELFSDIEKGEEHLSKAEALLTRYRQSVLNAAVTGALTQDWREAHGGKGESGEDLLASILTARREAWEQQELERLKAKGKPPKDDRWKARYKEPVSPDAENLPPLPEGWVWASVGQLGSVSGGITKNSKRGALSDQRPYLRVANVYADELRLDDVRLIGVRPEELNRALLRKGDLLIVEGNGSLEQIGRAALWDGSVPGSVHQNHIIKVRFNAGDLARFVLTWMLSPVGRQYVERVASSTSGLHTLSISKIAALPVPVPPERELSQALCACSQSLESFFELQISTELARGKIPLMRQALLAAAFADRLPTPTACVSREAAE